MLLLPALSSSSFKKVLRSLFGSERSHKKFDDLDVAWSYLPTLYIFPLDSSRVQAQRDRAAGGAP